MKLETHWEDCEKDHHYCALEKFRTAQASLIATQKERDDWKARAIGIDITLEGSNERLRNAEQALALRGEPVANMVLVKRVALREQLIIRYLEPKTSWSCKACGASWDREDAEGHQDWCVIVAPLYAAPISGERDE